MRMISAAFLTFLLSINSSWGQSQPSMNGISFTQFGDFSRDWPLVTVRFRKDTQEMRFVYANEIALKALEAGQSKYPDGAVFGKIGLETRVDPSFPASASPQGTRRIQFMVRDQKRYKDTDGWGYAIFSSDGQPLPGDAKNIAKACAACHSLVPERGYVFSQPLRLVAGPKTLPPSFPFQDVSTNELPGEVRKHLGEQKTIRSLRGPLQETNFFGTMDEIRPVLAQEVLRSGRPALLLSADKQRFSIVRASTNVKFECASSERALWAIHTLSPESKEKTYELDFCQSLDN